MCTQQAVEIGLLDGRDDHDGLLLRLLAQESRQAGLLSRREV